MKKYCENCGKEVNTKLVLRKETYNVCGEPIEVEAGVLVCSECGEDFYCEELDNATLIRAYNEYRKKHKLLLPEEIKKIREQYGLSQRSFAKLLNWGDKTIFRYENGSIQDKAHNSLLLFLREPANMRTYLVENEVTLDSRQLKKLLATVDSLQQNETCRVGKISVMDKKVSDKIVPASVFFNEQDEKFWKEASIDALLVDIASEFINYRAEHHLSQKDLAEKLHVSQSMVSKLESGGYDPSVRFLAEVAQKLSWNFVLKCNACVVDSTARFVSEERSAW